MYLSSTWLLNHKTGTSHLLFYKLIIHCYFAPLGMHWLVVKKQSYLSYKSINAAFDRRK